MSDPSARRDRAFAPTQAVHTPWVGAIDLSRQWSLEGLEIPEVAREHGATEADLVWRNEADGLTFRVADGFLKFSPAGGSDLTAEAERTAWLAERHPAPRVLETGAAVDGSSWLLTAPVPGDSVASREWLYRPEEAVLAIAEGLKALHALDVDALPWSGGWYADGPLVDPVVVHGDACAPNTLALPDGSWSGHVDVGALGVGDRFADLAIVTRSLEWNYGPGWEPAFWDVYGVRPDPERIAAYRRLWELS